MKHISTMMAHGHLRTFAKSDPITYGSADDSGHLAAKVADSALGAGSK